MFDSVVAGLDAAGCVAAIEANERAGVEQSCRKLILAAQWADLHPAEGLKADPAPGEETASKPGADGTPAVAGFAAAELGLLLGTTTGAASKLLGDALDLRHRLPRCWRRVCAGEVPGHHARRVAQATRHLSKQAADRVDAEMVGKLSSLSFGRFAECLEAAVFNADPQAAEAEAELAMRERFVRLGRTSHLGLKLIIARATAGEAMYLNAMLNRLAEILAGCGDLDSLDVRRSKALGLLAQPAEAMRLLYEHAEPDDHAEPVDHAEPDDSPDPPSSQSDPDDDHRSVRIVPPAFYPAKVRPSIKVYVHLSEESLRAGRGTMRMEGIGPVLVSQLRALVGPHVTIRLHPVIDLNGEPPPVDCYEVPDRMREHLILSNPADRFPFAGGMARGADRTCDMDHSVPYRSPAEGGPLGQTRVDRLGPLARFHHRVRTHGHGWDVRQPEAGTLLWRTPHGRLYLVNTSGSHALGAGDFAATVWRLAAPALAAELGCVRTRWLELAS